METNNKRKGKLICALMLTAVLVNCGGSGSSPVSPTPDPEPQNAPPSANAGSDQSVAANALVTLDASASVDSDGNIASFNWAQIAGTSVTLTDNNDGTATFTAPELSVAEQLSFEVTVTDDDNATASDTVTVSVDAESSNSVPASALEDVMLINELYYEYTSRIGEKMWVAGFYGNTQINNDGSAYLVDNMLRLEVDEAFPHHSFARLDGQLPDDDWEGNQILVYGEIMDFATQSGENTAQPTPLIRVEKYELISTFEQNNSWNNSFLSPDLAPENIEQVGLSGATQNNLPLDINYAYRPFVATLSPGTMAQDCDRSVIISGGVDRSNNHRRYVDNVIAKSNKMKELGFSDDQIEIFYNNGAAINVDGSNIVDDKTSLEKIQAHFASLAEDMPGSCTLTIFVTDHGTGYNQEQGYGGARPALSGSEATTGTLYDENTFKFDARAKVYRTTRNFTFNGKLWFLAKDEEGKWEVYKRVGERWVLTGTNANGDDIISETEMGGEDINGDGDTTDNDYGFSIADLDARLGERVHQDNSWDTDGDGTTDIRLHWDGSQYVVERRVDGDWQEMGRDTNGDFFIDIIDGGVDWNLDGDKADQVGFHEGINLWGSEVLWDDEFANILKPLSDKGVHIMVEMVSCFSGGFVPNIGDLVENIYTGSSEDTKHYNRKNAEGKYFAADEIAFLENLSGIDTDSWNTAADAATAADDALAMEQGRTKNVHVHEQTQRFSTSSIFEAEAEEDQYRVLLDLPDDMVGQIYDYEFILGLQKPRWASVEFPDGLPIGQEMEDAPGGIRIFSSDPIADGETILIKIPGIDLTDEEQIRIEFTDINHKRLGYTMVDSGDVPEETAQLSFDSGNVCVNHTDHGQSSPSIMEWLLVANTINQYPFVDVEVTVEITGPGINQTTQVTLNQAGQLYLLLNIFSYGSYEFTVVGARYVPTDELIELLGILTYPFTVTSTESNKGQCSSE